MFAGIPDTQPLIYSVQEISVYSTILQLYMVFMYLAIAISGVALSENLLSRIAEWIQNCL